MIKYHTPGGGHVVKYHTPGGGTCDQVPYTWWGHVVKYHTPTD